MSKTPEKQSREGKKIAEGKELISEIQLRFDREKSSLPCKIAEGSKDSRD